MNPKIIIQLTIDKNEFEKIKIKKRLGWFI